MKTAIKITAVAVITVLAALSCAPEVEVTSRDYTEYKEAKSAEYTNNQGAVTLIPTIEALGNFGGSPGLVYNKTSGGATPQGEQSREILISFPENADVLKETNANIATKLKEFINFYTYTNPITIVTVYTPSTLGGALAYEFVKRVDESITIRLASVPNQYTVVYKIDASKYTCYGQLLDINADGKAGEVYDDVYGELPILNDDATTPNNYPSYHDFVPPVTTLYLNIHGTTGGSFKVGDTKYISLTTLTAIDSDTGAQERKILSDILPNIEFQKYNKTTKAWVKDGTVALYDTTITVPPIWGFSFNTLYVAITPEDLGIYRVKATGTANLTSKDNIGAGPAKIKVNSDFFYNTVYSEPVILYDEQRSWKNNAVTSENPFSNFVVTSDANRKNIVIEADLISFLDLVTSLSVYPEVLTKEKFIESVKLVYNGDSIDQTMNPIKYGTPLDGYTNLIELKIADVKYTSSKKTDPGNDKINFITITLDPSYQINKSRVVSLLLSPDFKYTGGHITVGENSDVNSSIYNGTFFWRSYGQLPNF